MQNPCFKKLQKCSYVPKGNATRASEHKLTGVSRKTNVTRQANNIRRRYQATMKSKRYLKLAKSEVHGNKKRNGIFYYSKSFAIFSSLVSVVPK